MDIEDAWQNGVALISSAPQCLRAVCRLCGSLGQEAVSSFSCLCLDVFFK
jgi:hypothetical protein